VAASQGRSLAKEQMFSMLGYHTDQERLTYADVERTSKYLLSKIKMSRLFYTGYLYQQIIYFCMYILISHNKIYTNIKATFLTPNNSQCLPWGGTRIQDEAL
jgi:hypothetical protein